MPRFLDENASSIETTTPVRRVRGPRSRKKEIQQAIVDPPMPAPTNGYHPRPAKSAIRGAGMAYEPPYESASMPIGQRAEHPEYDTGHRVANPLDVLPEREAA